MPTLMVPHWVWKLADAGKCSRGGVNGRLYALRNGSQAASRHSRAAVKNASAPSGVLRQPGRWQARLARPASGSCRIGWSASLKIFCGGGSPSVGVTVSLGEEEGEGLCSGVLEAAGGERVGVGAAGSSSALSAEDGPVPVANT